MDRIYGKLEEYKNTLKMDRIYEKLEKYKNEIYELEKDSPDLESKTEELKKKLKNPWEDIAKNIKEDILEEIKNSVVVKIKEKIKSTIEKNERTLDKINRYKKYVENIEKFLDDTKHHLEKILGTKSIKSDPVYNYAKKEGMDDVLDKMGKRKMTYEEYEKRLFKINHLYAYVNHIINITNSETEREIYYKILDKIEEGTIDENKIKDLEEKYKERIFGKIPQRDRDNIQEGEKIIKSILEIFSDDESELSVLAKILGEKGWGMVVKKHPKFKPLRDKEQDNGVFIETFGVFQTQQEYDEFKSKENHNSEEAIKLINDGKINFLILHLKYFKLLNLNVLNKILEDKSINENESIKNESIKKITKCYNSFSIEINNFLKTIIDSGENIRRNTIITFIETFKKKGSESKIFCSETTLSIIKLNKMCVKYIIDNPNYFVISDKAKTEIENKIEEFIKEGDYQTVIKALKNIEEINHENFVYMIIEKDKGTTGIKLLMNEINNITGINHNEIVKKIISVQESREQKIWELLNNFHKLKGLDYNTFKMIHEIIKNNKTMLKKLVENINKFDKNYHKKIVNDLMDTNEGRWVIKKYHKYFVGVLTEEDYKILQIKKETKQKRNKTKKKNN